MYYYDQNLDYTTLSNDHNVYDLDEMCETYMHNTSLDMQLDAYDDDDEYARDTCDYVELAYKHYAWYNTQTSHEIHMYAQKRIVSVTLDIECYEDLDLKNINWNDILGLEGDENIDISIKETAVNY